VQQYAARRLNTKISSGATRKYVKKLEKKIARHHLIEKLGNLHLCYKRKKHFQRALNKLDQQSRDLMLNAEKKMLTYQIQPHPVLTRGCCLDSMHSGISLAAEKS
jgi:hypothetical protein